MIKKLLFVFAVAVCTVSCLGGGDKTYTNTYTLGGSFEYGTGVFSSDSLAFENQNGVGLAWQDLGFYHKLNEGKSEFLGGFVLSCLKGKGDDGTNRFRVNSGSGMKDSFSYLVYYVNPDASLMPERDIEFMASEYGTCSMIGCYVNNTKEVVNAVKENFVDGDRLSIKMTGYNGEKVTGTSEFVLAEYTEQKDSVVTTWSPFQLEKLGAVEYINIEIVTNRTDIPKAFCMDDIYANVSVAY